MMPQHASFGVRNYWMKMRFLMNTHPGQKPEQCPKKIQKVYALKVLIGDYEGSYRIKYTLPQVFATEDTLLTVTGTKRRYPSTNAF